MRRPDGSVNFHNKPSLFFCPALLKHNDSFSHFFLNIRGPRYSFHYRFPPRHFVMALGQKLSICFDNSKDSWSTEMILHPTEFSSLTFAHPRGFSASVTSMDGANELTLTPEKWLARFNVPFGPMYTNLAVNLGQTTSFRASFAHDHFLCGCTLRMLTDGSDNRNSCFMRWEYPHFSAIGFVTFDREDLRDFTFAGGLSLRNQTDRIRATIGIGPRSRVNLAVSGRYRMDPCLFHGWLSRAAKADRPAQWNAKGAVEFNFGESWKVVVAKLTSHIMVTVKTKLAEGVALEPSVLMTTANGAVGIRLQLCYDH
jgi:hypothetical protein